MCGICGEIRFDGQAVGPDRLQRMNDSMAARGPDDQGVYINSRIGLGHRRLSIIDLSSASHQPMHNEDHSISIVFNGTIYNYPQLRNAEGT